MTLPIQNSELNAWVQSRSAALSSVGQWLSGLRDDEESWMRLGAPAEFVCSFASCPAVRRIWFGAWDLMRRANDENAAGDPIELAHRVLVIEWLTSCHESDPAQISAPASHFAMPEGTQLMEVEHGGEIAFSEGEMKLMLADDDEERAAIEAEIERQATAANSREHAGQFFHATSAEFWPGGRYDWPTVVMQTWGMVNESVFKVLDEIEGLDFKPRPGA